jgi:excisionase family DNA binding protein
VKHLTTGEAAKITGKSKPTISEAVKDGRLSGQKVADLEYRLSEMKDERDQTMTDAKADRARM